MKRSFWIMIFVFAMIIMLSQCERNSKATEWRNGIYYPTRPGDQMYSYYHRTPRGTVRHPPTRYYQPPHRHYAPPVYRHVPVTPNVRVYGGRHGSVDVGLIHIRW